MWTPFDIVGLYYWYASAYMLYMHQDIYSIPPVVQVDPGDPIGQIAGQVLGEKTGSPGTGSRPIYTSDTGSNAYVIYGAALARHQIQNSENQLRFFFESGAGNREWTLAWKMRFHNATPLASEIILESNNGSTSNVGIYAIRRTTGHFINFNLTIGAGTTIVLLDSDLIEDTNWHDVVIRSAGTGANEVSIQIDLATAITTTYSGFLDATDMFNELAFGARNDGNFPVPCDMADLIILNQDISAGDLTNWRNFSQIPTMDPIEPMTGGFGNLIRSENASLTLPSLINARAIG